MHWWRRACNAKFQRIGQLVVWLAETETVAISGALGPAKDCTPAGSNILIFYRLIFSTRWSSLYPTYTPSYGYFFLEWFAGVLLHGRNKLKRSHQIFHLVRYVSTICFAPKQISKTKKSCTFWFLCSQLGFSTDFTRFQYELTSFRKSFIVLG